MRDDDSQHEHELEPEIPAALRRDLSSLFGEAVGVPAARDEAILRAARRDFARQRRSRMLLRLLQGGAGAAAAVIALVMWTARPLAPHDPVAPLSTVAAASGDIDGNGRIDILDAFALARQIEGASDRTPGADLNGDGMIDRRDVDAIALRAVRLEGGPS